MIKHYGSEKFIVFKSNEPLLMDVHEALVEGTKCGLYMKHFVPESIYNGWMELFYKRNKEYGVASWSHLGLRYLYSTIYAKYQRILHTPNHHDSLVDIFGYCILALIYCNTLGFSYTNVTPKEYHQNDKLKDPRETLMLEGLKYFWINEEIQGDSAVQFFVNCLHLLNKKE